MDFRKVLMWAVIGGVIGCISIVGIAAIIIGLIELSANVAVYFGLPRFHGMVIFYFFVVFFTFSIIAGVVAWERGKRNCQ